MNISLDFVSNCLHAFQYLLFAIPIAFTSKNSSWRTLAVILAGFLTYANLVIASKGLRKMADKFDFCITILLMFFHSFSILIVACVELRDISQKRKLSRVPPALKRAIGAIEWFSSSCGIGTRWQVKTITAMPPHSSSNRSYLIRQAFILGWLFLLNDCVLFIAHSGLERWGDDVYSPMICQFHFSFRKWAPRIVFTGVVFSKIRLHIDIVHRVAALVSVSAGIYRPQDWPPLFGSMGDAYTLRDFWGFVTSSPKAVD